jgi:hypothetical protein
MIAGAVILEYGLMYVYAIEASEQVSPRRRGDGGRRARKKLREERKDAPKRSRAMIWPWRKTKSAEEEATSR